MLQCTEQDKILPKESLKPPKATGKEPRRYELCIPELCMLEKKTNFMVNEATCFTNRLKAALPEPVRVGGFGWSCCRFFHLALAPHSGS